MPKVTAQPYAANTPAVKVFQANNADWRRTSRFVGRISDDVGAVRVWFGLTPDVSPGGTDPDTDGVYFDPSESLSDNMLTGDVWYAVVATGAAATDIYFETPGSQNVGTTTSV